MITKIKVKIKRNVVFRLYEFEKPSLYFELQ